MAKPAVVVVTGGFGVLGQAVAQAFVRSGAQMALIDRMPPTATLQQKFTAPQLLLGSVDLSRADSAEAAMVQVAGRHGGIDVLINIAGGFRWQTLEAGDVDGWDAMFAVNLKTAVVASRAALPHILQSRAGRIINIGAGAAAKPAAEGMGAYAAAKAGVHKFTESLAAEVKDRQVTVNAILPGTIDTPQNRRDMADADFSRWVAPAAIAEVIVFLASPQAAAVTGALIPVFGRG